MLNVLHIGSYDINIGDNIALYNVRRAFELRLGTINWHKKNFNSTCFSSEKKASEFFYKGDWDFVVVGGGGLLEPDTSFSCCKIPFTEAVFDNIKCPTFFISLGVNLFWGGRRPITGVFKDALSVIANRATYFSLRCDGSYEKVESFLRGNVEILPDSGFIFADETRTEGNLLEFVFQMAYNASPSINKSRFPNRSLSLIEEFLSFHNLSILPHTPKDLYTSRNKCIIGQDKILDFCDFDNTISSVSIYKRLHSAFVMRGHGQILSVALGVPSVSIGSQPKVNDFCENNGFENYLLKTTEDNFYEKMCSFYKKITTDSKYRNDWFSIRNCFMEKSTARFRSAIDKCVDML